MKFLLNNRNNSELQGHQKGAEKKLFSLDQSYSVSFRIHVICKDLGSLIMADREIFKNS